MADREDVKPVVSMRDEAPPVSSELVVTMRDEAPPISNGLEAVFRAAAAVKQDGLAQTSQSTEDQQILQLANYAIANQQGASETNVSKIEMEAGGYEEQVYRNKDELREQDRFLPIANVARIMKNAIPDTGKIAKDAKECVQECVSEFISFITSEASERCQQEKRKTINGEDILFAMTTLGFDNYVEPLKLYLTKYRESIKGEKLLEMGNYNTVEVEDSGDISHALQYQVANSLHPSMVSSDGTYAYTQAQISQLQGMHFET